MFRLRCKDMERFSTSKTKSSKSFKMLEIFYSFKQNQRKMQFKDLKTKKNERVLFAKKAICERIFAVCRQKSHICNRKTNSVL